VATVHPQQRDMPVVISGSGSVTALNSVDIKPQVTSAVAKVHIRDGQFVRAGELLFTLDARSDEANVAKSRAQLEKDVAGLADAQRQLTRAQQLFAQNFVSQGAVDSARAQLESMQASVSADHAALEASRVPLSYARVTAPLSGRAGNVNVSAGSVVQANLTTLVTVTQLDPIGVSFALPQRNLPDALAALSGGGAPVSASLADGAGSFQGRLTFVDNAVDASSGSVRVRAVFANKDGKLWPGAFVDVSQTIRILKAAIVIPLAAIVQAPRGAQVYVVESGKAALRPVQVVYAQANDAVVTGLALADAVVVEGRQNLRPGSAVVERGREPGPGAGAQKAQGDKEAVKPAKPLAP
jgi:RND family efflux transporter MFP subunit